jgi:hypothetical protein
MSHHEEVEFKTVDGLTLRGWLYPAAQKGPAMIVMPGVSLHTRPLSHVFQTRCSLEILLCTISGAEFIVQDIGRQRMYCFNGRI